MLNFLRKAISLDSPIRVFYHTIRGMLAYHINGKPSKDMIIIGVTGTKGKTTTSTLIANGLEAAGHKVFLFTTAHYWIAGEHFENNLKMTSPSPFDLQELLKQAKEAGCTHAIIETSSHSIFYKRNYGIDYDTVVLTNISQDHLDLHGTMENYINTKKEIFEKLVGYRRKPGVKKTAIINGDIREAKEFLEETADVTQTFGMSKMANVQATDIRITPNGMHFNIKLPSNIIPIHTQLLGEFNAYNITAAVSVLTAMNIEADTIIKSIEDFSVMSGRMEKVENDYGYTVFVDYAHTEASLEAVLKTVKQTEWVERVITVFGATGDRDTDKRPKMGRVASNLSDVVILTDDDLYSEPSEKILTDVRSGIDREEGDNFWIIPDRKEAIRTAIFIATPKDIVLLAGKGSEKSIITNEGSKPWDEMITARQYIDEKEQEYK